MKIIKITKMDTVRPMYAQVDEEDHRMVVVHFDNGTQWFPKNAEIEAIIELKKAVKHWNSKHNKWLIMTRLMDLLELRMTGDG